MSDEETLSWPVELEVSLFHAMRKHKPVGVPKHFQMMLIHDKLNNAVSKKIPAAQIWKHLNKLYSLRALDESEIIPFPNKETEFSLPSKLKDEGLAADVKGEVALPKAPKALEKTVEKMKEDIKESVTSGTAKRDGRKRTRGNVQSLTDTPPTSKRARRT